MPDGCALPPAPPRLPATALGVKLVLQLGAAPQLPHLGPDVRWLTLNVEAHTAERLHIKISPVHFVSFEVPEMLLPR